MASLVDMRQRVTNAPPQMWVAVGLSITLLIYSNATSAFPDETRQRFLLWTNLALLAALLAWALRWARMTAADLGLERKRAPASALFGIVISVLAAIPPVAFIALAPLFSGSGVEAPEITERSGAGMAYFLLFRQPVGTALFEEVAFRGVLYGAWHRVGGDRTALLATSAVFAAWHVVITSRTVAESGVVSNPAAVVAGVIVSLAGLFVGGLIFAYLRWHTRSIAAAVTAHWLIVALMTVTIWAMG